MKIFLLKLLLVFNFFTTVKSSNCVEHIYSIFASPVRSRSGNLLHEILCTNVAADLELDIVYEIKPYPQQLWIRDSRIPKLQANSSLSRFTHVNTLKIIKANLEEIEPGAFDGLVQLKELDLGVNKLRRILSRTFTSLGLLDSLHLHVNRIKVIEENAFLGLSKLNTLRLDRNELTVLNKRQLRDLKNLEDLWISQNPLRKFDTDLTKLKNIVAIDTNLEVLEVDLRNTSLDLVKFTNGQLKEVDFGKLPFTKLIQFENNHIIKVRTWNKLNCGRVFLHRNKISSFDISENVDGLFLKHNRIESIGNTFLGRNKKIKYLDLSFNKISEISSELLRGLNQLEILSLEHNQISTLASSTFINCPHLQKLDLSSNHIETMAPNTFTGIVGLTFLDISKNKLNTLEAPNLLEIKKGVVSIGTTEISWDYVKRLITNSEDLLLKVNQLSWNCDSNNSVSYISKSNVNNIICHYKKVHS